MGRAGGGRVQNWVCAGPSQRSNGGSGELNCMRTIEHPCPLSHEPTQYEPKGGRDTHARDERGKVTTKVELLDRRPISISWCSPGVFDFSSKTARFLTSLYSPTRTLVPSSRWNPGLWLFVSLCVCSDSASPQRHPLSTISSRLLSH